jgi:hypothetical protein
MIVLWNGQARATTYQNSNGLTATISAQDISAPGSVSIAVSNPATGEVSSGVAFALVLPPAPTVTALSPSQAVAGTTGLVMTVSGTNFKSPMGVLWNGQPRTTTFVNSTTLSATLSTQDLSVPGTSSVSVRNLATGQTSSPIPFTITPARLLELLDVAPIGAFVGSGDLAVTAEGSFFSPAMFLQWNGQSRPTTFLNGKLSMTIPRQDMTAAQNAIVTVKDPATDRVSNPAAFVVAPQLSGPLPIPAGLWQPRPSAPTPIFWPHFYIESDPGDAIGIGGTYTPSQFGVVLPNSGRPYIRFYVNGEWSAEFQAMAGATQFEKGYYPFAMRYSLAIPGATSFFVASNFPSAGCNSISGWFAVDSVVYSGGILSRIAIRFEQHCEGATPALHGLLRY